jgi:hypothetical protein
MKTKFAFAATLLLFLFTSLTSVTNTQAMNRAVSGLAPEVLRFSISIPETIQPEIVRQDFENQSIFSFKNESGKTAFLFSVNQVTDQQWLAIKENMKNYTILENKDGLITFIQKTEQASIKGKSNSDYQLILQQLDAIIASVKL